MRKITNKVLLSIFSIVIVLTLFYFVGAFDSSAPAAVEEKRIDIKSQCYTNLQPSSFFFRTLSPSPITTHAAENYIKIDFWGREFSYGKITNTGSMRPTLSDASIILFTNPIKEEIKVGDIVLIQYKNNLTNFGANIVLHRVIQIQGDIYVTKGDNNNIPDERNATFLEIKKKAIGVLW